MDRASINRLLRGTHDIARAAELLQESGSITYWQASSVGEHTGHELEGTGDSLRNARDLNCFEFVHLCNAITCCRDNPGNQGMSNLETQLFDLQAGFNEWDGKSPIPRGSVVVGTTPVFGGGSKGVYHVGIAVGDGQVVSNRNGQNVTKEPVGDVFGSTFYKVYYGPYPHCRCHEDTEEHFAHSHGYPLPTTGTLHELPRGARQTAQRLGAAGVAAGLVVVTGGVILLGGLFGSTPAEPTPLPTLPRVTATVPVAAPTPAASPSRTLVTSTLQVKPIAATFTQQQFSTTYATGVTAPGLAYSYRWAGPNCGTYSTTSETPVTAAHQEPLALVFVWNHPHPPCAATTNHSDVTVTLTVTWSGGTLICAYPGTESGIGASCKPF